jgi:hypothetical protein
MSQTRRASFAEALTNTLVGGVLSYLIVLGVILLDPNPASAAGWAVTFNIPASAARSYIVRRFFNGVEK